MDTWHIEGNYVEERNRELSVPAQFASLVRAEVHTMFLEKNQMPTIDKIFEQINQIHPEGPTTRGEDSHCKWLWGRTTLYKFMNRIGFCYEKKKFHYEHTREKMKSFPWGKII